MRQAVAEEAARLLEEQGARDHTSARIKAAARLGVTNEKLLPRNDEIELALKARQRLFRTRTQPMALRSLREAAVAAMEFLRRFEPRLVGSVLDGTADMHSAVCLDVFHDDALEFIDHLLSQGVEFEQSERRVRYTNERTRPVPAFRFEAGGAAFEIRLFALDDLREAPLDRIRARPQKRAALGEVVRLLDG